MKVNAGTRLMMSLFCALVMTALAHAQTATTPPAQNNSNTANAAKKSSAEEAPKKSNARPANSPAAKPEPFDGASVKQMNEQCVTLETEAGAIEIEMLADAAPESVRNFLNLSATGAYDRTTFHRVVKDFVIQGGNLATRQTLTPELARRASRTIPDEPSAVKHERGIVSMARPEKPNSATTNFFIILGNASHLDGTFAAFGRVVRGMDIADAINHAPAEGEKPDKPVRITRAIVAPCKQEAPR